MGPIHLVETQQLQPERILHLFQTADFLRSSKSNVLAGKILATLFYEPSTRTRLSFESAMLRLGGSVISTENAKEFSSAVKGESIEDTVRVVQNYADCIVIRHHESGATSKAAEVASVPIINAGDGSGQHPTQALLDLYTIYRELGKINGLTIALVGDLAFGRTVRSLCYLLGKFTDVRLIFVSPENLRMRDDIKAYLMRHNIEFHEETELLKVLPIADVVYSTRIQKERMSPENYEKAKGRYVLDENNFPLIKPSSRILHPLPHVEEITLPIKTEQNDPRVAYFRQVENGLYIRMAILLYVLGVSLPEIPHPYRNL